MRLAAIVPVEARLHQVVSAVLKVALQVVSMARQVVAMVLRRPNNMEASRVAISSKVAKAGTDAHHHPNHSMEVSSSSTVVNSSSMEVEDMVRLRHSLLVTRCVRKGMETV